jgi:glutaryl-CoA dehydrogenase
MWEVAKVDTSLATFIGVNSNLGIATIEACGDEEQKDRMLPDCYAMKKITSFALTEPNYGSDATSMESFAVKATDGRDGYILNGEKRWIGNGTFADYVIVWAKNRDDKDKIQAFIVEKG